MYTYIQIYTASTLWASDVLHPSFWRDAATNHRLVGWFTEEWIHNQKNMPIPGVFCFICYPFNMGLNLLEKQSMIGKYTEKKSSWQPLSLQICWLQSFCCLKPWFGRQGKVNSNFGFHEKLHFQLRNNFAKIRGPHSCRWRGCVLGPKEDWRGDGSVDWSWSWSST